MTVPIGTSQNRRDFLVRELLHVGQQEDLAMLGGQRLECGGNLFVADLRRGRLFGRERLGDAGLAF